MRVISRMEQAGGIVQDCDVYGKRDGDGCVECM